MHDTDAVMEIIKETFPQPGSGEGEKEGGCDQIIRILQLA